MRISHFLGITTFVTFDEYFLMIGWEGSVKKAEQNGDCSASVLMNDTASSHPRTFSGLMHVIGHPKRSLSQLTSDHWI